MNEWLLIILLFVVSVLYSSVGHGGASSYLSLMAIYGLSVTEIRPSVLILNILVSSIAFIQYAHQGHFHWKKALPFLLLSIPMAYWGATFTLDIKIYKTILGVLLIIPVIRLLGIIPIEEKKMAAIPWIPALLIGALIGYVSGLIGIGGGILLSPILLFFGWANMKQTAAISALFIALNSFAGLVSLSQKQDILLTMPWLWWTIAFLGAMIGATWGSRIASMKALHYTLAIVLILASIKLILY
ncbi:MAG: sulfite exporter TauE/SafE family protein [Saprospiraceae bacterium]